MALVRMQSSDLCKTIKVYVRFVGLDIRVMVYQIIGIRLTGHGMAQYAILVYQRCHHKCYIGRNPLHGIFMKFVACLIFVLFFQMALDSHRRPSSILAQRAKARKLLRDQATGP